MNDLVIVLRDVIGRRATGNKMTAIYSYNPIMHVGHLQGAEQLNERIVASYNILNKKGMLGRSHFFGGRFENFHPDLDHLPELKPVLEQATVYASILLGKPAQSLKRDFWINEMAPGQTTSTHDHDEDNILLSAVYYIYAPKNSGNLIIHDERFFTEFEPADGIFVFFAPTVMHSVSENLSNENRLSMGMNFSLM